MERAPIKCIHLTQDIENMREKIGFLAAATGFILVLYLMSGFLNLVPLLGYQFLGETLVRFIGQCAIVCFLVAAWGYWRI
jgi:hypothetical protein